MAEFDIILSTDQCNPYQGVNNGSAYIEDEDDTRSINSLSTNATMDNNPGVGLTIDKYFYQPVGRAIEKYALKIAMRLNICHPSPAQILRLLGLGLSPAYETWSSVQKPCYLINLISAERPSAVPGILSLVQQSQ